jgi:hypothetical protein
MRHHALQLVEMGSQEPFCPGWPQTVILSISISQVARITASMPNFKVVFLSFKSLLRIFEKVTTVLISLFSSHIGVSSGLVSVDFSSQCTSHIP